MRLLKDITKIIDPNRVIYGEALQAEYSHIWKMHEGLTALALVKVISTKELSTLMRWCYNNNQKVVIHGGKTNLVGSTESDKFELVISLELMNKIEELDPISRTMTVQSGVILEEVQQKASEASLLFPLNFGAKGSAQMGGIISTNAGGLRVLKYGMTRQQILGLEVVLADGTIIHSMKKIIKDNSGYDLKQMFIGAEGTLGIITRAVLKLTEAPKTRMSAFVGMKDYDQVVRCLKFIDRRLAGKLSGYELIWQESYEMMTGPMYQKPPVAHGYSYYVLIESLGGDLENDASHFQQIMEQSLEMGLYEDGALAHSESDLEWFWKIREDVHVLVSQGPVDQHFDISLPIPLIGDMIAKISELIRTLDGVIHCFPFGHVADGNIHLIVLKQHAEASLTNKINDIVYEPLKNIGGSVSAEHGIGTHKKHYLAWCRTPEEIALMQNIKRAMDPKGILNFGKIF